MRHFWKRVRGPRNDQVRHFAATEKQRIADHDARHGIRHMRELEARTAIACRINIAIAGLQKVVDFDAASRIKFHLGQLQIHAFHIGFASRCNQQLIKLKLLFFRLFLLILAIAHDLDHDARFMANRRVFVAHRFELDSSHKRDSALFHRRRHDVSRFAIFFAQNTRRAVEHRHFAAQQRKSLSQLAANGTTANHAKSTRQLGQIPDALVGQIFNLR
mmetsp:Transcript_51761/g.82558  ORF Transcript_51761/g.82558 Transcript_51761/m.82558 type:complete len:217 (-) Transcript_51761:190-840(-)